MVKKKEYKFVLEAAVMSALRRLFVKSPLFKATKDDAKEAYTAHKKDGSASAAKRVHYKCASCKKYHPEKGSARLKNGKLKKNAVLIAVDHVDSVMAVDGSTRKSDGTMDWNTYLSRLFVGITFWDPKIHSFKNIPAGKLQILCKACHDEKSFLENSNRKKEKKAVKNILTPKGCAVRVKNRKNNILKQTKRKGR